ncbi:MAG: hypothetical protein MUQ30_09495 [Anaerolineae bacterium]|nr:hypothetical protein [Anaerolineae bacterium]
MTDQAKRPEHPTGRAYRMSGWQAHAQAQVKDAVNDAKSCGLTYEETVETIVQPPDNCTDVDDLLDYTHMIQRWASSPWASPYIQIEPTMKGALRRRFALAGAFIFDLRREARAEASDDARETQSEIHHTEHDR